MKRWWNLATLATRPKPPVGSTPADAVFGENKWRLLRYRRPPVSTQDLSTVASRTPLLLVPSLINRHYILDLMPGKSLAEYLVARGHEVYVIDWGTPTAEDRFVTFDDIADRAIGRALTQVTRLSGQPQAHLLGYCLGGTLAAIHAAARPKKVASLVALAAPIRFGDDGLLAAWTRSPGFDVNAMVDAFGLVPWQLTQGAFQMLRPTLPLAKAVNLLDRAWNDRYLDGYLALEAWANDNVSLPGEFYRRYIDELYRGDALWQGRFAVSGKVAALADIRCPVLAVTFAHDGIAPAASCAALVEGVASVDKSVWTLPGSHVGGVVSREASQGLWPALSAWWTARDG